MSDGDIEEDQCLWHLIQTR